MSGIHKLLYFPAARSVKFYDTCYMFLAALRNNTENEFSKMESNEKCINPFFNKKS